MKIIGLTGKMGVGKSTIANMLKEVQQNEIILVKFAQPLYDIQEMIYERISTVYERPKSFIKDRKLLQFLGTDWARNQINSNLWVDLWKIEVMNIQRDFNREGLKDFIIVADDVRFDNEAEAIKALGGVIVKVIADDTKERIKVENENHESEKEISSNLIDAYLNNTGSLAHLKELVTLLVSNQFQNLLGL